PSLTPVSNWAAISSIKLELKFYSKLKLTPGKRRRETERRRCRKARVALNVVWTEQQRRIDADHVVDPQIIRAIEQIGHVDGELRSDLFSKSDQPADSHIHVEEIWTLTGISRGKVRPVGRVCIAVDACSQKQTERNDTTEADCQAQAPIAQERIF